jgi:hypothetical protein
LEHCTETFPPYVYFTVKEVFTVNLTKTIVV